MISKSRTVAIIQARMGSTRFPGKMLAFLGDFPIIEWVIRRLLRAKSPDQIVLATSDNTGDDPLSDVARRLGIEVFRGSETDVLDRFVGAARITNADNVIRVCADNPFIDPTEVDRLAMYFASNVCDYACNHQDRLGSRYADGFGAEILSARLLGHLSASTVESRHREHVTLYLWDHLSDHDVRAVSSPIELAFPEFRFDVDTTNDISYLKQLIRRGVTMETSAPDIIRIAQEQDRQRLTVADLPPSDTDHRK